MNDAIGVAINKIQELGIGKRKVNYRMRDAGFSRQRYWGEPFPVIWSDGIAIPLDAEELPLELPFVEKYGPGPEGEGPLANIKEWALIPGIGSRETSTMPGYAGSSWYFLRYMDPKNTETFCDRTVSDYWNQVDVYIGGTEHAVGHLLYSRMWTKILFDLGYIGHDEPFKKLVNQGMITGSSRYVYRIQFIADYPAENKKYLTKQILVSFGLLKDYTNLEIGIPALIIRLGNLDNQIKEFSEQHPNVGVYLSYFPINVNIVDGFELDINKLFIEKPDTKNDIVIKEEGKFFCKGETEKMSKRLYNTVNPVDLCNKYGADTFRMYEMFLGPVEMSKPWDTKGIEGVHRFLRKMWRLFYDDIKGKIWTDVNATDTELKILHRTIKKIEEDTERFSFNTAVSTFMICVNELTDIKCYKKEVLEKVLILLASYAPHIAEELWQQLGNEGTVLDAEYPVLNPALLVESSKEYPISINGKVRANISLALNLEQADVEKIVLQNEAIQKWLEGKDPKKIIYVKNKMVNVVV